MESEASRSSNDSYEHTDVSLTPTESSHSKRMKPDIEDNNSIGGVSKISCILMLVLHGILYPKCV